MRPIGSVLRRFVQEFGYDVHRVGGRHLGRNHFADVRHLCGTGGVQTIFDVGANKGQSALTFAEEFPEANIYSFEPFPTAHDQLTSAVGHLGNVHTFKFGLGEKEETRRMFVQTGSELNSLFAPSSNATDFIAAGPMTRQGECEIQITTLDSFCGKENVKPIDLLKIDTQGAELLVLKGATENLRKGAIKTIFLEVNFVPLYEGQTSFGEIVGFLDQFGYGFVGFYDPFYADAGFLKWTDALFVLRDRK